MKVKVLIILSALVFSCSAQAVQVAFFIDDQNPQVSLEGQFSHVAISYKGKWLHSHPSKVNGRLASFPGVHLTQNLTEIGLNFIVFENLEISDPSDDFYESVKNKSFNILAEWTSKTETHCSILVGKYLGVRPTKMKFKASIWRNVDVKNMRGKLGLSPKEIFDHVQADSAYKLYYQSPFSTFKFKVRKLKCSSLILGR